MRIYKRYENDYPLPTGSELVWGLRHKCSPGAAKNEYAEILHLIDIDVHPLLKGETLKKWFGDIFENRYGVQFQKKMKTRVMFQTIFEKMIHFQKYLLYFNILNIYIALDGPISKI